MPSAVFKSYHYHEIVKSRRFSIHSGRVYHYLAVPEKVFKEMRSTMVKGIWFNRHFKGKYRFEEVTPGLNQQALFEG